MTVPPDELEPNPPSYVTLDKEGVAGLGGVARSFDIVVTDVAEQCASGARRDLPGAIAMNGTSWFANEIRGRHVLIGFLVFFGLIFLVNGVFLYSALTTFGGGEKGSPYRKWPALQRDACRSRASNRTRVEGLSPPTM